MTSKFNVLYEDIVKHVKENIQENNVVECCPDCKSNVEECKCNVNKETKE